MEFKDLDDIEDTQPLDGNWTISECRRLECEMIMLEIEDIEREG